MVLRVLAGATAGFEFALQTRNLLLVPGMDCEYGRVQTRWKHSMMREKSAWDRQE